MSSADVPSGERFHERMGLRITQEEARRRFVARVAGLFDQITPTQKERIVKKVAFETGDLLLGAGPTYLEQQMALPLYGKLARQVKVDADVASILSDWEQTLIAIEALYGCMPAGQQQQLSHRVDGLLQGAEVDLGIAWRDGRFQRKGARLLDEALVHDELDWLAGPGFAAIRRPFAHGLRLYRVAGSDSEMLKSAVASMYEAVEAMAKLLTKSDRDLSALKAQVVKALGLPRELRAVLDPYVAYGSRFRHADSAADSARGTRPHLGEAEAEFFLYLTGLLLRLGHRKLERVPDGADEDRTGQPQAQ